MFVGCKPTESNYKSAYDAALAKREQAAAEQMRPSSGLLSDDGPQMRVLSGDTVFVVKERLRSADGTKISTPWAVAVGVFKMDTNAKAAAEALREQGFPDAFFAKAAGGKFYSLCAPAANLDSARIEAKRFVDKVGEYPFVGLPGAPVLISTF